MGNMKLYKALKSEADEYLAKDFSNFGMAAQLLNGGTGGNLDHVQGPPESKGWSIFDLLSGGKQKSAGMGQEQMQPAQGQLSGMGQQAPQMFNSGMPYNPTQIIQPPQRAPQAARPAPKVDLAPKTQGPDQYGHTIGEIKPATRGQYKGRNFKYIGNDQWQPI
jgi:hypothetical protein